MTSEEMCGSCIHESYCLLSHEKDCWCGNRIPKSEVFPELCRERVVQMAKTKRITRSGGLVIPRDIRVETGFLPGVPVSIEAYAGELRIRKHTKSCRFCGSVDCVKTVSGIEICKRCAEKVQEVFYE